MRATSKVDYFHAKWATSQVGYNDVSQTAGLGAGMLVIWTGLGAGEMSHMQFTGSARS